MEPTQQNPSPVDNFINDMQAIAQELKALDERQEAVETRVRQMEVDARALLTSGISAEDRTRVVRTLMTFITESYARAVERASARAAAQQNQQPIEEPAAVGGFADAGFPRY